MSDPISALRAVSGTDSSVDAGPLPNIPAVPATDNYALNNILSSVKLWIEKASSNGITGFATKQDLVKAGLIKTDEMGNVVSTVDLNLSAPPVPTGLTASGAMSNIILTWDNPLAAYKNHGLTEVWAAEKDDFGQAVLIGQGPGFIFSHAVGEDSTRYYWIRFVSTAGIKGPFNSVNGTLGKTAKDPAFLMSVLTEEYGYGSAAPFFQVDAPITINGVTVPAGTYMKSAFIAEATISRAMIQSAAIDSAKIADAAIVTAKIADAQITAAKIQSIDAGSITTGTLSADRIDTNTLVAKNVSVNTSGSGARLVMTNSVIKVYDAVGALRVQIGDLAA